MNRSYSIKAFSAASLFSTAVALSGCGANPGTLDASAPVTQPIATQPTVAVTQSAANATGTLPNNAFVVATLRDGTMQACQIDGNRGILTAAKQKSQFVVTGEAVTYQIKLPTGELLVDTRIKDDKVYAPTKDGKIEEVTGESRQVILKQLNEQINACNSLIDVVTKGNLRPGQTVIYKSGNPIKSLGVLAAS